MYTYKIILPIYTVYIRYTVYHICVKFQPFLSVGGRSNREVVGGAGRREGLFLFVDHSIRLVHLLYTHRHILPPYTPQYKTNRRLSVD